ncbi:unnamed protein product [Trifolium pratense]|uniref:Uncharacterized protein n=1 Tax=Trifolium pratense TaxID=57577 RepID=A0ACB0JUG7_TRIPR|nr:unnamed protein product [Trifolium pratense]
MNQPYPIDCETEEDCPIAVAGKEKNMVKTLKFVHAIIYFFSIFLVVAAMNKKYPIDCETQEDCPVAEAGKVICYEKKCWRLLF